MKNPKIAFGMIVFEGDYVLKECLEQVYPYATQILIAEGPVKYWQDRGRTTSTDKTNEIIDNFPDPENKISIVHGQYSEKDEQCNAYLKFMRPDIDYLWNLDSDELYLQSDIEKMITFLEDEEPTSVGVRSKSFYGGFDDYLTGFELNRDNFLRLFRVTEGSTWLTHRPPTIHYPDGTDIVKKHIDSETLYKQTGIEMYHYSYVFPTQVQNKIEYYQAKVSRHKCIENYFGQVFLPWVLVEPYQKYQLEKKYSGVHEFKPEYRGDCYTAEFDLEHPKSITNNMDNLKKRFQSEMQKITQEILSRQQTAWHDTETLPSAVLNAGFKPLGESDHFNSLNKCINLCQGKTLLDIGCGLAEAYSTFPQLEYTGVDLPHMIREVAQKNTPDANYIAADANKTDFAFIKDYDIILMNSFLSEIPSWHSTLAKILTHASGDIIIHRQEVSGFPTMVGRYNTYGDLPTLVAILNKDEFRDIIRSYGYKIIIDQSSHDIPGDNTLEKEDGTIIPTENRTFLLRKEKDIEK